MKNYVFQDDVVEFIETVALAMETNFSSNDIEDLRACTDIFIELISRFMDNHIGKDEEVQQEYLVGLAESVMQRVQCPNNKK